jgi:hypothetical protein
VQSTFSTLLTLLALLASFGHAQAAGNAEIKSIATVESHNYADISILSEEDDDSDGAISDSPLSKRTNFSLSYSAASTAAVGSQPQHSYSIRAPPHSFLNS